MDLRQALEAMTQRHLWAVCQARGLNPGRSPTKAGLVDLLHEDLGRQEVLDRQVRGLTMGQRQALDLLLAANGPLPLGALAQRFGDVRPYQPWRGDSPVHPWLDPSPLERLVYLGLAYPGRVSLEGWGEADCLFVPANLRDRLPIPPTPAAQALLPPPGAGQARPQPLPEADLLHDCFTFLSFANCHDLVPRQRRWLTAAHFRTLNERFGRPEPLHRDGRPILGEKQMARLRFVHFLLEAAGLIALAGEAIKPAPAALTWLEQPPLERLRALWQAWGDPRTARQVLWHAFDLPRLSLPSLQPLDIARFTTEDGPDYDLRLPPVGRGVLSGGETRPMAAVHRVIDHLRGCRPGQLYDIDLFIAAICLYDLDFYLHTPGLGFPPDGGGPGPIAPDLLGDLLRRYLRWSGLIVLYGDYRAPTAFGLTAAGAALLGLAPPDPATAPPPARPAPDLRLSLDDLSLEAGPTCPPAVLYRLEPWVEWLGVRRYRLLPASVQHALERGGSLDDLLQLLAEGTAGLPPDVAATLRDWADAGQTLVLRQPVILQAHSREVIDQIAARPALRAHLRETLSPRHVVVDARDVEALVRELRRHGHHPRLALSLPRPALDARPDRGRAWTPGEAAHLLLAARVFNGLARLIRPVSAVPAPVLDALRAALDEREAEAVEQLAGETLARLAAAQDGWTPHGPAQEALPVAQMLALVEEALAGGQALDLEYWTAGREQLTRRRVDPLRLETRRGVAYLVAYCHLRHAERVFRLDRVRAASLAPRQAGPPAADDDFDLFSW